MADKISVDPDAFGVKYLKHRGKAGFIKMTTSGVYTVLTIITLGMAIGALLQLSFMRRIEHSSAQSIWGNDEHARILRIGHIKQEVVSWSPRIIHLHNFLSPEECDYLMAIAKPRLAKSTVVDTSTGKGVESMVRTSTGMFLSSSDRQYRMIQDIENRIAVYSMIPAENGELVQVLRYEPGQYYKPHHDYFSDEFNLKRGGQRVATMLMYLADVEEGGETYFPWAGDGAQCSCGGDIKKGICVKPRKGNAVLFWSMKPDGTQDPQSIHGSCSVLKGEKWSATKWMRQRSFS